MARLLIVHHTPSPHLHSMLDAVRAGANDPLIDGVEVEVRAALAATASDVLGADGVVVGGPANLGYLAGAVKHFFDTVYYPCLEDTVGRPFGAYLHGNDDTTGARRALDSITTGLRWQAAAAVVEVRGAPSAADLDACRDLGGVVAATIAPA
ncbi:MAG: flavodoxin family protein [Acidimicrobiales bacterium]|mgnify:CR=1 FL=1|nr:flavodoxin family protein [Acidimicrobiales bacterium]